jgi:decaprenyl-phosphate phosphoribosyltransferase
MNVVVALVKAARPRQWVKNVLVLAAPVAAGEVFVRSTAIGVVVAFAAFCLAASGIYLINDVRDIEDDRRHPKKRYRPIAAGTLPIPVALAVGAVLLVVAPVLAALVESTGDLWVVVVVYEAVQLAYCLWLKHQPVIDLAVVSSGFLLRAIAGGVACGLPLSQWFLLVAAFGSLFMVAGKRYSEKRLHAVQGLGVTRRNLEEYSEQYLRFVWALAAALVVMSYSLWAFQLGDELGSLLPAVSIAPFLIGVLRYAVDVDAGKAGAPEEIVLGDRVLQLVGVAWLVAFVATVTIQ